MSHCIDSVTKIRLCHTLYKNGISPEEIYPQLDIHRATMYRWLKGIKLYGVNQFIRNYKQAKRGRKQPRKTDPVIKDRVYKIRNDKKQCCGEKIQYFLKKDYDTTIGISTIYRILGEKYQLRSKWKKYCKRGHVQKGKTPREAIQTDTVDFGGLFAFTSIDTYTREVSVIIRSSLTSRDGKKALQKQLKAFGLIKHIQRDGGPEFKDHWQKYANKHISSIRTARPYKKNEQAFIERFNGVLRKECLGYRKFKKSDLESVQKQVDEYLDYYHNERPHLSLDMKTPKQFAMSHLT
jgi:IS30 family transposase